MSINRIHKHIYSIDYNQLNMLINNIYIQGVPGGSDKTSGECSLC